MSIPSNIVEGASRQSARDYARFLEIAHGSAVELRYLVKLCVDLELLSAQASAPIADNADHVARVLNKLRQAMNQFAEGEG